MDAKPEDRPCYRTPAVSIQQRCHPIVKTRYEMQELVYPAQKGAIKNGWQWLIGKNPSIAVGFPIKVRENNECGLEVTLEIMTKLGTANNLTEWNGTSVIKGFNSIFVLSKKHSNSAIWNYHTDIEGHRISYNTGSGGSSIESHSIGDLRHFII
jgi:hypothetical protein